MDILARNFTEIASIFAWVLLWSAGGVWLARAAFLLQPVEQALAGVALGLVVQTWLANLLGQVVASPLAFWLAAGLVFLLGLAFSLPLNSRERWLNLVCIPVRPLQLVLLVALTYVFAITGMGLGILDDYQNLPTTSILASGQIPPIFALDPNVEFDYHYFTMLTAAQFMRIGGLYPWNSLDIVRGFGFALAIILGGLWILRVTRSQLAALLSGLMAVFGGGTRWLLLLLPASIVEKIAPSIQMIGSGAQSGETLAHALTGPWAVETGARWAFPFAYGNGINVPSAWTYHSGAGGIGGLMGALLLLTHNRWRGWRGAAVTVAVLAAFAISSEVSFTRLMIGMLLVGALYVIIYKRKELKSWAVARRALPASFWRWVLVFIPAGIFALFQGGVLTGVWNGLLANLTGSGGGSGGYFTFSLSLNWPPAFLSSHLGFLSLLNPAQLLVALAEIGPILLLLPFAIVWGLKAFRSGRWYEAAIILFGLLSTVTMFIQYTGNAGPTALNRVQSMLIGLSSGSFALAGLWLWARRASETRRLAAGLLLFVTMFGGFVLFGIEMLAAPEPLRSTFVIDLDARMMDRYWDQLEENAVIYDHSAFRSPTLFARPTNSHITWYESKPEWDALNEHPDPYVLRAAGFDYMYLDEKFFDRLTPAEQQALQDSCVVLVDETTAKRTPEFRQLLDIRACQ